jgi:hypothetical protein
MDDSKPRDLTPEELALLETPPPGSSQSAPLQVPPGTQISIEELDPLAPSAAVEAASPTQPPPQSQ